MRGFLQDSDQMKIFFVDMHLFPYQQLSSLFCEAGNHKAALDVAELGRARALADLMATQYSAEKRISADPKLWAGVENVTKKETVLAFKFLILVKESFCGFLRQAVSFSSEKLKWIKRLFTPD